MKLIIVFICFGLLGCNKSITKFDPLNLCFSQKDVKECLIQIKVKK